MAMVQEHGRAHQEIRQITRNSPKQIIVPDTYLITAAALHTPYAN